MLLADSCFNITHESFKKDLSNVISEAYQNDIEYFFAPSCNLRDTNTIISLSKEYKNMYVGVGIHPHYASEFKTDILIELEKFISEPKVVAIGEIGLDYYRNFQTPKIQRKCFSEFLSFAVDHQLPCFMHNRNSTDDFLSLLKEQINNLPKSVVHCFTGNKKELKHLLDQDLFIGITGWICDPKRGAETRDLLKYIPLEKLLLETDSPYLIPKSIKGSRNEPKNLKVILKAISEAIGVEPQKVAKQTTKNFKDLFRL